MTVIYAKGDKEVKYPHKHDPDEKKFYAFCWKPEVYEEGKMYLIDDIFTPSTPNGFYYVCTYPGIAEAEADITLSTVIGKTTESGTAKFVTYAYDFMLLPGDTFTSVWLAEDIDTTIDNDSSDNYLAWARVTAVPSGATTFKITNRVTVTRTDSKEEVFDRSLIVPIANL